MDKQSGSSVSDLLVRDTRSVISTFSWRGQIFFKIFNATGLLKNWKTALFV